MTKSLTAVFCLCQFTIAMIGSLAVWYAVHKCRRTTFVESKSRHMGRTVLNAILAARNKWSVRLLTKSIRKCTNGGLVWRRTVVGEMGSVLDLKNSIVEPATATALPHRPQCINQQYIIVRSEPRSAVVKLRSRRALSIVCAWSAGRSSVHDQQAAWNEGRTMGQWELLLVKLCSWCMIGSYQQKVTYGAWMQLRMKNNNTKNNKSL